MVCLSVFLYRKKKNLSSCKIVCNCIITTLWGLVRFVALWTVRMSFIRLLGCSSHQVVSGSVEFTHQSKRTNSDFFWQFVQKSCYSSSKVEIVVKLHFDKPLQCLIGAKKMKYFNQQFYIHWNHTLNDFSLKISKKSTISLFKVWESIF